MGVPRGRDPGIELHDDLHDLAPWNAEIVPLEIDASGSRLLRSRHVNTEGACDDDRRPYESPRAHVNRLPRLFFVPVTAEMAASP
jgi:hypothetical protein